MQALLTVKAFIHVFKISFGRLSIEVPVSSIYHCSNCQIDYPKVISPCFKRCKTLMDFEAGMLYLISRFDGQREMLKKKVA